METQRIFVYGTLQSVHPEHAFCPAVASVRSATVIGSLYQLRQGYPILRVDPGSVILRASGDSAGDWSLASSAPEPGVQAAGRAIRGEVLEIPLEAGALRRMDEWEGFVPGRSGAYQRVVINARTEDGAELRCWAYAALEAPANSELLDADRWQRPEWLKAPEL